MRSTILMLSCLCIMGASHADPVAAPTFQDLMDPALFPDPQMGMEVESAALSDGLLRVSTTGADIELGADGVLSLRQRLGSARRLASASLGGPLSGLRLTHSTPGLVLVTCEKPRMTLRINGDSLVMLQAHEPLTVSVRSAIPPEWHSSFGSCHIIADEWGAFGLYCSENTLDDAFDPYAPMVATYDLPADAVLWLAVCPPKPYDWERSLTDNVVWHWSMESAYPPDETLTEWQPHGDIVLLQSEVMLWRDWNLEFVPRLGMGEFARVRDKLHELGMRMIVYTSPYYFLRGTALEPNALNSFEGFTNWPPGSPTGENMGPFIEAISRVMSEYQPDGLYFDGQYTENPAALYALARRARQIVGEDGILEWHSTGALGQANCSLPQADAYCDFILRGEGQTGRYDDDDYLRFFVSGYNIHNSIGVLCNNDPRGNPTPDLTRRLLDVNRRYHTLAGWLAQPDVMAVVEEHYNSKLTPALRGRVDAVLQSRQAAVPGRVAAARAERRTLYDPVDPVEPAVSFEFDAMPDGEVLLTPEGEPSLQVEDGRLNVEAPASTYAFVKLPVATDVAGFEVKLRQGTDGGMSWGPAAMLRWADGSGVRIGTRTDGQLQADVCGRQLLAPATSLADWVWLRARWGPTMGVVEVSYDGSTYVRALVFEHGGALDGPPTELLVGKVPYNGEPQDFSIPGGQGACEFDFVKLYAGW